LCLFLDRTAAKSCSLKQSEFPAKAARPATPNKGAENASIYSFAQAFNFVTIVVVGWLIPEAGSPGKISA